MAIDDVQADGAYAVTCTVSNAGDRDTVEVVQVYAHLLDREGVPRDEPAQRLVGFAKVAAAAGSTQRVRIDLDGRGDAQLSTGIGFFDHMLDQIARHGLIDLTIEAKGDLHIDGHHTVEDVGLVIGEALRADPALSPLTAAATLSVLVTSLLERDALSGVPSIMPVPNPWLLAHHLRDGVVDERERSVLATILSRVTPETVTAEVWKSIEQFKARHDIR